ncbi:hypothetical protein DEO72_LG7g2607 [Vigna unguiculata]|uniref:Homeobox domain-containing protein n=1 Tax=Vigna unguiculata TaxID=3917 RepID=A0A4D6MKW1_VIGUN|nr:hypothetical protein DEO72_LG7g2606 [Vigna unguiculata]QCE01311.1 hypothetical protein DEO72_LG7g2607 [Vigna unguiculata]
MDEGMSGFCIRSGSVRGKSGSTTSSATGTKCGRWNPTTEQVKLLTELFRSGLRTPSTDQIQKISTQLSFYGKIESKNVFYWFQNHKARERQKRRKVSFDDNDVVIRRQNSFNTSSQSLADMHRVSEPDRVVETLQLFPINSFGESEPETLRLHANECRDNSTVFSYTMDEQIEHPPLDLRLSFL